MTSTLTVELRGTKPRALVRTDSIQRCYPVRVIGDYDVLEVDLPDAKLTTQRLFNAHVLECASLNDCDYHVNIPDQVMEVRYVISPLPPVRNTPLVRTFTFELTTNEADVLHMIVDHMGVKDHMNPVPYLPVSAAMQSKTIRALIRKGMLEQVGFGYMVTRLAFLFLLSEE